MPRLSQCDCDQWLQWLYSDSSDSQSQIYLSEQTTRRDTAGAGHTATWWLLSPAQARILLRITDTVQQYTNLMMGDGNMSYRIKSPYKGRIVPRLTAVCTRDGWCGEWWLKKCVARHSYVNIMNNFTFSIQSKYFYFLHTIFTFYTRRCNLRPRDRNSEIIHYLNLN